MDSPRILIADDNVEDRALFRRLLPEMFADSREAGTLAETFALLKARDWQPDAILLDLHLPDGPGPLGEVWLAVHELAEHAPVIVVSASSLTDDPELGRRAKEAGAAGFTSKELILFSPENLARQIDWATCPAGRSLALAVKDPEAAPELGDYNPNSLPALIARLISQQDAMHAENQTTAIQRKDQLDRIEAQVQKTNGRVSRLETWREDQAKLVSNAAWVLGILAPVIFFLFGDQLKERALLDKEAVRRIAAEVVTANPKPVAAGNP